MLSKTYLLLCIAILATYTGFVSAQGCYFHGQEWQIYSCDITGAVVSTENDDIDLSGVHIDGHTNSKVQLVRVRNSHLTTIPSRVFETFRNLETFDADTVKMERIDVGTLRNCNMLMELRLRNNLISRLENGVFRNCGNIFQLMFTDNRIEFIGANVFRDLFALQEVLLQNNRITVVHENWFRGLGTLRHIILSGNQITRISSTMFHGNVLRMLVLSSNNITEIAPNAFRNFRLTTLSLAWNSITTIGKGAFAGVGTLVRGQGSISLMDNLMTRLSSDVFDGEPSNVSQINVSNNRVEAIERDFFEFMDKEFSFVARNNVCVNSSFFSQTADGLARTLAECVNNF